MSTLLLNTRYSSAVQRASEDHGSVRSERLSVRFMAAFSSSALPVTAARIVFLLLHVMQQSSLSELEGSSLRVCISSSFTRWFQRRCRRLPISLFFRLAFLPSSSSFSESLTSTSTFCLLRARLDKRGGSLSFFGRFRFRCFSKRVRSGLGLPSQSWSHSRSPHPPLLLLQISRHSHRQTLPR